MNKRLSIVGMAGTLVYLLIVAWWVRQGDSNILEMKPNEVGDFLAGVFGPVAILWLILGFFQQGEELRQNTKALELQAEELRHSVEQQKSLVEATQEQVKAQAEEIEQQRKKIVADAQPVFAFDLRKGEKVGDIFIFVYEVTNIGRAVSEVRFSVDPPIEEFIPNRPIASFVNGANHPMYLRTKTAGPGIDSILTIAYIDGRGAEMTAKYRVYSSEKDNPASEVKVRLVDPS